MLVDTHCHIDHFDNPLRVIERARLANVAIVAVTESPSAYRSLRLKLGKAFAGVEVALGAHPLRIKSLSSLQRALFFQLLPEVGFVGEVGLDFSAQGVGSKKAQLSFFEQLLAHPSMRHLPMTVHSRAAASSVISMLEAAEANAILHWFTGSDKLIDRALATGAYFSVNPSMPGSKSGNRLLTRVPRDRLLIETDGPFVSLRGRPCEPTDASLVMEVLARTWKVSLSEAQAQLQQNFLGLKRKLPVKNRLF